MADKGHNKESKSLKAQGPAASISDFVLDKVIFSNVFERDIRRIYIYRKSERLAKAIQLITPGFGSTPSLRNRLDGVAVGLIDAAILPPASAKDALSRELLALSSLLSVARTGGLLSDMNADLITREAHSLLQEIATYEEPRLFLDEVPSLAELSRQAPDVEHAKSSYAEEVRSLIATPSTHRKQANAAPDKGHTKGHDNINDATADRKTSSRQEAILSVLQSKGPSYIKDVSIVIRDVSEKTIQRELQNMVQEGLVLKEGERRWTQYSLPDA